MKKFAILRSVEPTMTRSEVDVAALQSIFSLGAIDIPPDEAYDSRLTRESQLSWIRSFWHEGSDWGLCLYTARSVVDLEVYHTECAVPYVAFDPVAELRSDRFTEAESGRTRLPAGCVQFSIEATLPPTVAAESGDLENIRWLAAQCGAVIPEGLTGPVHWVRAYVHESSPRVLAVYAAPDETTRQKLTEAFEAARATVRPLTEITPEEYIE
ncbi:MAG: hypothetical protein AB7T37_05015 [Dehalococcoidia bacterium]